MKLALASPLLYKILVPWRKYKYLAGSLGSWTIIGYVLEYATFLVATFAPSFVVIDVYNDNSETTNAIVASFTKFVHASTFSCNLGHKWGEGCSGLFRPLFTFYGPLLIILLFWFFYVKLSSLNCMGYHYASFLGSLPLMSMYGPLYRQGWYWVFS